MKTSIILLSLTVNLAFSQSSILIEPSSNNGILAKNSSTVSEAPITFSVPISGEGTRIMWMPAKSAFRVGTVTETQWDTHQIGTWSFASGLNSIASGENSNAVGLFSTASGIKSTAIGNYATATGDNAIALGNHTTAQSFASIAVGQYNMIAGTKESWINDDPLFVVGNGVDGDRSNAMTVLKNGNIGVGSTAPLHKLEVVKTGDEPTAAFGGSQWYSHFNLGSMEHTYIRGGKDGAWVFINDRSTLGNVIVGAVPLNNVDFYSKLDVNGRIRIRHTEQSAGIWFSNSDNALTNNDGAFFGMNNATSGSETAGIWIGNSWKFFVNRTGNGTFVGCVTASNVTCPSDFRYKKNIKPIENSLSSILKMEGVRYDWRKEDFPEKNFSDKNQIGFIAQEIEKIFPEMVITDEKGYKSVDYGRLTPVLVEAMKELTIKNEKLESRLEKIEAMLSKNEISGK